MKIIIAGSRSFTNYSLLSQHLDHLFSRCDKSQIEIVSGRARGADRLGERYAHEHGIPIKPFPVTSEDWKRIGKKAGHLRNVQMAEYGDALVDFWDGVSPGSRDMIDLAHEHRLRARVIRI